MRIPARNPLQALRGQTTVNKAEVDALAKQAGADPAARAKLAQDLLSLGGRLDADAADFARSMLAAPKTHARSVVDPSALSSSFRADVASAKDPAEATLTLSAYAAQLARLTADPGARERIAAELLGAATQSPAVGDPDRPEGDPWSASEWTETAPGWRDTTPWGRLVAILDARGLRPAEVARVVTPSGWWGELSAPSPLFRAAQAERIDVDGADITAASLSDALASLAGAPYGDPLVTRAELKAALEA